MRRVLSVFLPHWATERAARRLKPPEPRPILIVEARADRQFVAHASPAALGAGVTSGMDLAHARALIAGVEPLIVPRAPAKDAAALEGLARWATRWTPLAAADQPDGILLDLTGCEHLFGGERTLARALWTSLRSVRLTPRMAIASTVGAAWALARFGPSRAFVAAAGKESESLGPLPIEALRLEAEVIESLREVGIEKIGQLAGVPRSMLPARYGESMVRRLDQAFGSVYEPIFGEPEAAPICAGLELPGGTTQWEAVALAVQRLLLELSGSLERRESGLCRLDATFDRLDSERLGMTLQVGRPTRSAKHLWSLLSPKVERLNLGYGISGISLRAAGVVRLEHRQAMLLGDAAQESGDSIARALDAIANRIGADRVRVPMLRQCHRPERAASTVGLFEDAAPHPAGADLDRPSVLVEPPEPVRVIALSPDGPVMSVRRGEREHRIIACVGPERIGGEWWTAQEPARDYFRVQDDSGRWLWVYREPSGAWFIHGEWA